MSDRRLRTNMASASSPLSQSRSSVRNHTSRSYQYGYHPIVTSPETRSAHLYGQFFPPASNRDHVSDQRLTTPGLIGFGASKDQTPASTAHSTFAWRGFSEPVAPPRQHKPAPHHPFNSKSTVQETYKPHQITENPGVRVRAVPQPPPPPPPAPEPFVSQSVSRWFVFVSI